MVKEHSAERPYPGLRPFEPWEGDIFFGREAHTDRLLEILHDRHFLTVIGPSGSGKSSLVRAGLLPVLPLGAIGIIRFAALPKRCLTMKCSVASWRG